MTVDMLPIVLTHYGKSEYLRCTLESISRQNAGTNVFLIGDDENKNDAIEAGIHHISRWNLRSTKKALFNDRFRWVQGSRHIPVKNGQDWLRWQWERWFLIECLIDAMGIDRFWHLDSDVIITREFHKAEELFIGRSEKELIAFPNLNGLVPSAILRELTSFALEIFSDEDFIDVQRGRFVTETFYALTEMNAVEWFFEKNNELKWIDPNEVLEDEGLFMDPAILQSNGMKTHRYLCFPNSEIKDVVCSDGSFYVKRRGDSQILRMVTANCSWVPIDVSRWFVAQLTDEAGRVGRTSSIGGAFRLQSQAVRRNLIRNIHVPIWSFVKKLAQYLKA